MTKPEERGTEAENLKFQPSREELEQYEQLKRDDEVDESMALFVWHHSHRHVTVEEIADGPDWLMTQLTAKLNRKYSGPGPKRDRGPLGK